MRSPSSIGESHKGPWPVTARCLGLLGFACLVAAVSTCLVNGKACYENSDCDDGKICNEQGKCVYECKEDQDCAPGFKCIDHRCIPQGGGPIACPSDMVAVANTFCIDIYEASRPGATASSAGIGSGPAQSRAGVIPWQVADNAEAAAACEAAGKRLCSADEWFYTCGGPDETVYAYGDSYEPATCNGIDTYGIGYHHLMPTASFPECTNEFGVYDINGNLWEHILGGNDTTVRGGAYNCSDSKKYQRCDYIPGWTPSALGFRCCKSPDSDGVPPPDAGGDGACLDVDADGDADTDADADADADADFDASFDASVGCPPDMVGVGSVCIDRFEASQGPGDVPLSEPLKMPWYTTDTLSLTEVESRCARAGKRACTHDEWASACGGSGHTTYAYGDTYDWRICLGIEHFCDCTLGPCIDAPVCPFERCNTDEDALGNGPCSLNYYSLGPVATGSLSACRNDWFIYDMNGNVWELTDKNGSAIFKGGAFNCINSLDLHRCNHSGYPGSQINAKGFRCCKDRQR